MDKQLQLQLRDDLEEIREKADIIKSMLQAVYAAEENNIHESGPYMEAIHGVAYWAYELVEDIQSTLKRLEAQQEA